jgi:hypothetical protein
LTHAEQGTAALEQVEFFARHGVASSSLVLSHTDRKPDLLSLGGSVNGSLPRIRLCFPLAEERKQSDALTCGVTVCSRQRPPNHAGDGCRPPRLLDSLWWPSRPFMAADVVQENAVDRGASAGRSGNDIHRKSGAGLRVLSAQLRTSIRR